MAPNAPVLSPPEWRIVETFVLGFVETTVRSFALVDSGSQKVAVSNDQILDAVFDASKFVGDRTIPLAARAIAFWTLLNIHHAVVEGISEAALRWQKLSRSPDFAPVDQEEKFSRVVLQGEENKPVLRRWAFALGAELDALIGAGPAPATDHEKLDQDQEFHESDPFSE